MPRFEVTVELEQVKKWEKTIVVEAETQDRAEDKVTDREWNDGAEYISVKKVRELP